MVIVTHEVGFAQQVASRLIFIDKGRIAEDGDPHTLITNPPSERLREFYSTSPDAPQAGFARLFYCRRFISLLIPLPCFPLLSARVVSLRRPAASLFRFTLEFSTFVQKQRLYSTPFRLHEGRISEAYLGRIAR